MPQSLLLRPGATPWAPQPWSMFPQQGQLVPMPVPVPVPVQADRGKFSGRQGGQSLPAPGFNPFAALNTAISPQTARALGAPSFMGPAEALGALGRATAGAGRPQGGNETFGGYYMRQGLEWPLVQAQQVGKGIAERAGQGAQAVGQFVGGLMQTPNSLAAEYAALIGQESGGRQFGPDGKPLIGRDSKGRVPGADRGGPAYGVAQMQIGTARDVAKQLGIPFDEQRFYNDPQYNYQLGLAHYQQLRQKYGNPALAAGAYHSGQGNVDRAVAKYGPEGFVQGLGPEGQNYVQSVMGRMGQLAQGFGTAPPAFNAAPFQQAMAAQDAAAALLSQPYSAELQRTPLPERPAPAELQAPDYTAGDAAFAQTAPKNPFDDPKEAVRLQRQQYWKGLGQAMASLSGEEGIGTMLMKLGAGALIGRARGQEMVDAKEEEFQKQMQEFNRALASRNDQKATAAANILNQNIAQRNQYNEAIWSDNVREIEKFQPNVVGDKLITYKKDPADPNKYTMNVTPLGYGIQAEALLNKAQIGLQMGTAAMGHSQWEYANQQTTARTALGLATQMAIQSGTPGAATEGYLTEGANRIRASVQAGTWRSLFGNDVDNLGGSLDTVAKQRAYESLGITRFNEKTGEPLVPLEPSAMARFQELYQDNLTANIYEMALKRGTFNKIFSHPVAGAAYTSQMGASERRSVRTDSRGRRSYSTSWDMGE